MFIREITDGKVLLIQNRNQDFNQLPIYGICFIFGSVSDPYSFDPDPDPAF